MGSARMRMAVAVLALLAIVAGALLWWRAGWDIAAASTNLDIIGLDDRALSERGIRRVAMGLLEVPTGALVVADPLVQPDRPPLVRTVAPGRYAVVAYEAEGRTAVASLVLSDAPVARWELALIDGQDMAKLARDEYFGFPVDAGLGSIMDKAASELMLRRESAERAKAGSGHFDYYNNVLAAELPGDGAEHIFHQPIAGNPANAAIFGSGWGDGFYPAIWGLDAEGAPTVLVTDFHVLENGRVPELAGE